MSKMDNLRAMREAKYAANAARASAAPTARKAAPRPPVAPTLEAGAPAVADAPAPDTADELCGHRNMGGRTCTRERGHTAKSHRYS